MKIESHDLAGVVDLSAYTIAGLTVMEIIPAISGILAIIWFSLQISHFIYNKLKNKDKE